LVLPLQQVINQGASVQISDVFFAGGPPQITHISVDLAPLADDRTNVIGILISYTDVSRLKKVEEELQTISQELETALEELQSAMSGLGSAVVVIDTDYRITMWSRAAEEMWGVHSGEARGEALEGLDIGLPVEGLMPSIRRVLARESPREQATIQATNRRGKGIQCAVSVGPLGSDHRVLGAILLMEVQNPDRPT